jgi:hypothetical protein
MERIKTLIMKSRVQIPLPALIYGSLAYALKQMGAREKPKQWKKQE